MDVHGENEGFDSIPVPAKTILRRTRAFGSAQKKPQSNCDAAKIHPTVVAMGVAGRKTEVERAEH